MSTVTIELDTKRYGRLLAKAHPTVIKSDEENDRMHTIIDDLISKGDGNLSREEEALLELLIDLVHDYEAKAYPLPSTSPRDMISLLLEQHGLRASDLWTVIGSKARVSEILSGKRAVSKEQAKKLAAYFHVGVELFI